MWYLLTLLATSSFKRRKMLPPRSNKWLVGVVLGCEVTGAQWIGQCECPSLPGGGFGISGVGASPATGPALVGGGQLPGLILGHVKEAWLGLEYLLPRNRGRRRVALSEA